VGQGARRIKAQTEKDKSQRSVWRPIPGALGSEPKMYELVEGLVSFSLDIRLFLTKGQVSNNEEKQLSGGESMALIQNPLLRFRAVGLFKLGQLLSKCRAVDGTSSKVSARPAAKARRLCSVRIATVSHLGKGRSDRKESTGRHKLCKFGTVRQVQSDRQS